MPLTINELVAAARSRIHEITPQQAAAWPAGSAVWIDVREPGEYAAGHLPGAANLPRGVLEFRIHAHPPLAGDTPAPTDRKVLLYCQSGGRSALAADSLRQLGFQQVYSLAGGIQAWRDAGLPVGME